MPLPELRFNFHDSLLYGFVVGPRYEATLKVRLYEIFYPGGQMVLVRFGKIANFETVRSFLEAMELPEDRGNPYARLDALCYDPKMKSTSNDLHFFLELDGVGKLQIHCGKMTIDIQGKNLNTE